MMTRPDGGGIKLVVVPQFDALQRALVAEIVRAVRSELERAETPSEIVASLTGAIAFSVTSLIDDTAGLEVDGRPLRPILAFQLDGDTLGWAGGNSWMHEYVYRIAALDMAGSSGSCA